MADTATFDEFVTVRSRHLLRIAYLLSGDHTLAEDLLQIALAKSWTAWRRIQGDPEPYVRRVLVNTYNSWWRRRWHGERPTEFLPEQAAPAPQANVDERDQVWRALGRLPRQQRTVLVLRYFEDLSEAEIAQTLDISPGAVKAYASRGLASLRLDPTLRALPLPDADDAPAGNERLVAVRERITQRRRNRLSAAAAACLIVLAALGGYTLAPVAGLTDTAGDESWHAGFQIVVRGEAPLSDRSARFGWTPGSLDLVLFPSCATAVGAAVGVEVQVNDTRVGEVACGTQVDFGIQLIMSDRARAAAGLRVGVPATVTLTVAPTPGVAVPDGQMVVAVGERLPFPQRPLPSPPANGLLPLPSPPAGDPLRLHSGARSASIAWPGPVTLRAAAQTPGVITVRVNGFVVQTFTWDDYKSLEQQGTVYDFVLARPGQFTRLPEGESVVVEIDAELSGGDWYVTLEPRS